jgi:hypothetical protein
MHNDGLVRVLYEHDLEIPGAKVSIFECGEPPTNDFGDVDAGALFKQTFLTDNSKKNVFYEAYVSGSNKPFFASKTPPTKGELLFQLQKSQKDAQIKYVIWVVVGLVVLYLIFK